ncbi:MAG TPA: CHAT domain-containing protein [Thermoanaerobaculia bacterium]|nr:CHAT domain-containing protein [Thermoanaerobaculia bacterium]
MSDLAAEHLAAGQIADAAEESACVLQRDPSHQTAAFNWALALDHLSNRPAAITAWERYLALDSESGWAAEAREHIARLNSARPDWSREKNLLRPGASAETVRTLVGLYPQHVRALVQDELLLRWVKSDRGADIALLRMISSARAATGDPFLSDVVEHAAANRLALIPGLYAFVAAHEAAKNRDRNSAARLYAEAAAQLERAGSPLSIAAAIYAANNEGYLGHGDESLEQLTAIDKQLGAKGDRYPAIAAEAAWVRGLQLTPKGDPQGCLDAYRRALAEAKRGNETEHAVAIAELIATQVELVGDPAEAEQLRNEALRHSDEINADPARMYVAFYETAFLALRAHRPHLAIAFLESAAGIARAQKDPQLLAETGAQRALALLQIGEIASATTNIRAARTQAHLIETAGFRERATADVEYIAGSIEHAQGHSRQAIRAYSEAIAIWQRRGWRLHLQYGRLARGEAAMAAGDLASAEQDFRLGTRDMETQRSGVSEEETRIAYFERADRLFERLIEVLIDQGRPVEALSVAERKQSRALLDRIASSGGGSDLPMSGEEIAASADRNAAIVEIALLDRGAELWLVRSGTVVHARSASARAPIEESVSRHRAAIASHDDAAVRREGAWLFEQLLAPFASSVPPGIKLVVVADGGLRAFPFATLVDPSGRYLLDRNAVVTAPSATIFLRAPWRPAGEALVVVAQPAPEGFAPLNGAAAEAARIARNTPNAHAFIGDEVTPAKFLSLADSAACIHFSGHAETDLQHPSRSALMFESADPKSRRLTAAAIAGSHLRAHPLVVLASCSTGRGKLRHNEGIDSLSAAFLKAGASGVVATLWDIDDDSSAALFRSFHEHLRRGARAADALRDAQRALLHGSNLRDRSPSRWGAVVVMEPL